MRKCVREFGKSFEVMLFIILCFVFGTNYASNLNKKLNDIIRQALPNAMVGVYIQTLDGKPIYAHHADKLFNPACNTKLYTAAAALYSLGPNYHYETSLSRLNEDIFITFSGAPDLTSYDLSNLLQQVSTIKGNLVLDTKRFKPPYYLPGYSYDELGWGYSAPCHSVIINKNAAKYAVKTTDLNGEFIELTPVQ